MFALLNLSGDLTWPLLHDILSSPNVVFLLSSSLSSWPVFFRGLFLSAVPQDSVLVSLSDYSVLLGNLICSPLPFPLASTRNTRIPKCREQTGVFCCLLEAVHFGPTGPFHLHFKLYLFRSGRVFHLSPEIGMEYREVGCVGALGSHSRCVTNELCNLRYHIISRIPLTEGCR